MTGSSFLPLAVVLKYSYHLFVYVDIKGLFGRIVCSFMNFFLLLDIRFTYFILLFVLLFFQRVSSMSLIKKVLELGVGLGLRIRIKVRVRLVF